MSISDTPSTSATHTDSGTDCGAGPEASPSEQANGHVAHPGFAVGFVAIGRNEGERLRRCLESLVESANPINTSPINTSPVITSPADAKTHPPQSPIVYVDSGSTDDSLAIAAELGVMTVDLDDGHPFAAARARNKGYEALIRSWPSITHVMFIDGDCTLVPTFTAAALAQFSDKGSSKAGIVTGFCREMFPERSVYNLLCDLEWQGPVGQIDACGGIFMIDREAFEQAGGFNPAVIAAEDDELCLRVRAKDYIVYRIDHAMCFHDANMTSFSQWWKRSERAGHAYTIVGDLHPPYFSGQKRRAWLWAALIPVIALASCFFAGLWGVLVLGLYPLSFIRTRQNLLREGRQPGHATRHAFFLVVSKFPNLTGILKQRWTQWRGRTTGIVEYK